MRIVKKDTQLFLEVSERLLEEGYCVRFRAGGASMQPAINDGDALILAPVDPLAVRPGHIVMYRKHRRGIAHRVVDVQRSGEKVPAFLLRGDAATACDLPVEAGEILGGVVAVERGHKSAPDCWQDRIPRLFWSVLSRLAGIFQR